MAIKDWSADERPREKLLQSGAAALSDADLFGYLSSNGGDWNLGGGFSRKTT